VISWSFFMSRQQVTSVWLIFVLSFVAAIAACDRAVGDLAGPRVAPSDPPVIPVPEPGAPDGGADPEAEFLREKSAHCPSMRAADPLPQRTASDRGVEQARFDDVRLQLVSACGTCHLFPSDSGGLVFQDNVRGSDLTVNGTPRFVPGWYELGEQFSRVLRSGSMPPSVSDPAERAQFQELGETLSSWVRAGRPEGTFETGKVQARGALRMSTAVRTEMTNLGDCLPDALGADPNRDLRFAREDGAPKRLSDTDLTSLDSYALARLGTVAYAPAYPLWSDGAKKLRHVHLPADTSGKRATIAFDPTTREFSIPENTRFYKTFMKPVRSATGDTQWRKVETRLIVVRKPPQAPIFAVYRWNEAEDEALLVAGRYRDGQPFRDAVFRISTDEANSASRTYAIPARHRCLECHEGASGRQFVLGFTPLQLNRRVENAGGVSGSVGMDELTQMERLTGYQLFTGLPAALPKLEQLGAVPARNARDLDMQGYLLGNCTHCHNPNGFASRQDRRLLSFDLSPGKVYDLNTSARGVSSGGLLVIAGEPEKSELYVRVAKETALLGAVAIEHMPLHTPGIDCQATAVVGRWVAGLPSYASANPSPEERMRADALAEERARVFASGCAPTRDITWLEEDFTEPKRYVPRRADWQDPVSGIPPYIRDASMTSALTTLSKAPIAIGYWNKKPACTFPDRTLGASEQRPWMNNPNGTPKRPYGEVFAQTAGAFYFATVCQKCHGARADGEISSCSI
jgi:hypothetical protein